MSDVQKLGVLSSLLVVYCHIRGGLYGDIVSQPLLPICLICVGVPGFLAEGIILYISIDSGYLWEEASSGPCYNMLN